ncbi:unnamed protein product [Brassica oleracea var. botrytis]
MRFFGLGVWQTYVVVFYLFLSKGDFEGDKMKTLPWSCSAVIFAGNLSDYDESRFSFMP